jgi:hypothetical protein
MTRKDYELIAKALHDQIHITLGSNWTDVPKYMFYKDLCETLATRLGEQNPRFDRNMFIHDCEAGYSKEAF